MLSRLNRADSRVIMGKGGRLPNGQRRVHVRDLQVGDVLFRSMRITEIDTVNAQPGRILIRWEEDQPGTHTAMDHTFDEPGLFDWKLDSLTTREARPGEE